MKGFIKNVFFQLLDIIYPARCPLCDSYLDEKGLFCKKCLDGFKRLKPPFCSICAVPFDSSEHNFHICEDCYRKRPYFESVSALYIYNDSMAKAVQLFKYKGKISVLKAFGRMLAEFALQLFKEKYVLIPVPLSLKRLRERGFNQSLILARYVAKKTGFSIDYMSLKRVKETSPQSLLNREERKKNVKDAFRVTSNKIKDQDIILVDDVITTGSTLNECAKALKKAGAKRILCLALARTDPRHFY